MTGENAKQTEEVTSEMYYAFTYTCAPWGTELPWPARNPEAAVIRANRSAFLIKSLASLAGRQLEAEGMSRPAGTLSAGGREGCPARPQPWCSAGTGNKPAPQCRPHSTAGDALIEQRHSSSLDLIHSCWVLPSSAQEPDCRVEITRCRENKGMEVNQRLFHIHPAAKDFAMGLWIPRKLDRVCASRCLMCYKLEKNHFYLHWVWVCFPHCNWHHIFLTASLKSLIWRGSQRPTPPGTIPGFKSTTASPRVHQCHGCHLCELGQAVGRQQLHAQHSHLKFHFSGRPWASHLQKYS